jgi:hypothetical protein
MKKIEKIVKFFTDLFTPKPCCCKENCCQKEIVTEIIEKPIEKPIVQKRVTPKKNTKK